MTADETCVHHFIIQKKKKKQAGMQWTHPTSPRAKEFKVCQSAGKVMASAEGVILVEFMLQGTTVNVNAHCFTLR
jgi:hypothetical protein